MTKKYKFLMAILVSIFLFNSSETLTEARTSEWTGIYFPTENFTGVPIKDTSESINFDWKDNSPINGIPSDHFSAIFKKDFKMEEGIYNLRIWANDGVQVYVDGKLQIDAWGNKSNGFFAKPVYLKTGNHTIMIKYKEITGWAKLQFEIDDLMRDNRWYGMAFSNPNFTGDTRLLGYQPQIFDVNFNWGRTSPAEGIPSDHFSTLFQRKINVDEGAYNLRVWANDGVRVYVDGKLQIDAWDNESLKFFGKPIYLESGTHKIMIKYKEIVGLAELRFEIDDLMRDNRWYGMAFSNPDLTGNTKLLGYQPQISEIDFDWGRTSPAEGIPSDHFSTLFQKKINVDEGAYNLRVWANDGVRVYVDGKLQIDAWDNESLEFFGKPMYLESGTHKIMIKYKEIVGLAELRFEIDDLMRDNRWYGLVFPNKNLTGTPKLLGYQSEIPDLDFNWGTASPAEGIPADNFSTLFQRNIVTGQGDYQVQIWANDGVRVYVDGRLILDQWNNKSSGHWVKYINLSAGKHKILVKNFEESGVASLKVKIEPKQSINYTYHNYDLSLNTFANIQMTADPQTDKSYKLWIREDAFESISNGKGIVDNNVWNLRRGPGTNYMVGDQVNGGTTLNLYSSTKIDSYIWYHVRNTSGWVTADKSDVRYYLDPNNFTDDFRSSLQFMKLSQSASINISEVNEKILKGKGILEGKADVFVEAGRKYGVNEIYLMSHSLLETGNGTSKLATGIKVDGDKGERVVYNMYGIGAYDDCANECGAQYAYEAGWFTPELAIKGGASFIGGGYIQNGQDTLYKMRWDPEYASKSGRYGKQYATDIGWAFKQTRKMNELYNLMDSYSITFEIPKFN